LTPEYDNYAPLKCLETLIQQNGVTSPEALNLNIKPNLQKKDGLYGCKD
jgi:hypothetical protein